MEQNHIHMCHVLTCTPTRAEALPSQLTVEFGYTPSRGQGRDFKEPCAQCVSCVVSFPRINSPESPCEMLPYAQVISMSGFPLPFFPCVFAVCDSSHEEQSCCLQINAT